MADAYAEWCREHGCGHGHCPGGCEHPQPFLAGGELFCGRCAVTCGELVRMVPCDPGTCGELT